jgi:hypothetical protein
MTPVVSQKVLKQVTKLKLKTTVQCLCCLKSLLTLLQVKAGLIRAEDVICDLVSNAANPQL